MGAYSGPEVNENGLVLALDAGNSKGFDSNENLLAYSKFSFSSMNTYPTGWIGFNPGRVVRSIGQSPDGTDAAIVGKQYGNSGGFRPTSVTLSASTNYTVSFYARKPTDSELSLFLSYFPTNDFTTQPYTKGVRIRYDDVDTSTGSTGSTSFTLTDTWQRFTYTFNSGSDTAISPNFTSLTVANAYDSNGLFVIASVQVEKGSSASPYYPTTGTSKTRGTTLIDMTGNGNTGTLTNGPTYSSANGGSIVFDGTDDAFSGNFTCNKTYYSVDFWCYPTTLLNFNWAIGFNSFWGDFGIHTTALGGVYVGTSAATGGRINPWRNDVYVVNTWQNFTWTFDNGVGKFYKNGILEASGNLLISASSQFTSYYSSAGSCSGRISNFKVYSNKVLSASEIQQNFNALRGRYGI